MKKSVWQKKTYPCEEEWSLHLSYTYLKISSKWIQGPNEILKNIKALELNNQNASGHCSEKRFLDLTPKAQGTKTKEYTQDYIRQAKACSEKEKKKWRESVQTGENICKLAIWQVIIT